jgi:hypothetical protein
MCEHALPERADGLAVERGFLDGASEAMQHDGFVEVAQERKSSRVVFTSLSFSSLPSSLTG